MCLSINDNPQPYRPLRHSHQTRVCPLRAGKYQTIGHFSRALYIRVGLSPLTRIHVPSTYSHQSDPRPLPFCHFLLRWVYSPSIQVITQIPSACSHQSAHYPLHPHGHRKIHLPCSHSRQSGPWPPWDRYAPSLRQHETPLLLIILMFHESASS